MMAKKIIASLLILCLLISAAPIYIGAATAATVTASDTDVYQGNYAYVYISANDFKGIASLDLYVYYDSSIMSVYNTSNGSILSAAQSSTNTSKAGTIKLSAISLDGISGSGDLMTVTFAINSDAPAGEYPVRFAIGDAYDTSLSPATIKCTNSKITVKERVVNETFYISGYSRSSTYSKGDILEYKLRNTSYYSFTGAEFIVEYDHETFEFVSAELGSGLMNGSAIYSVNSQALGQVRITYASVDPAYDYYLFTVNLRVISNDEKNTTIKATAQNVYREDLTPYLPGSASNTFTIRKLPEVIDHPDLYLETEKLITGESATSVLYLEQGSKVAAGDFSVVYDPAVLRCVAVTRCDDAVANGAMVVINENFKEGKIRFSYVNMTAYDKTDLPLIEITWEPVYSPLKHYQLTVGGVGVVDTAQNPITLEYVKDSSCIYQKTVIPPTCLEDGRTIYRCSCGDSYGEDEYITPALGHDMISHEAKDATCAEVGWYDYIACSRCDLSTYVEIPSLDHDEIYHEGYEPTCTESGWDEYVTCSNCDYSTYVELAPTGHQVIIDTLEEIDPVYIENDESYPFIFEDDVYVSTNHDHSSDSYFTITALYDCELYISYAVSSENYCDTLIITVNGDYLTDISGETDWIDTTVNLNAGDNVVINYHKDGSVDHGSDTGSFMLWWEMITLGSFDVFPAESMEPTCNEGVVCSFCGTEIKEALGHDEIFYSGRDATCTDFGWNDHVVCSRCDYSTLEEIEALGHDEIYHEGKDATCTEIGWDEYITCSRCDFSTYNEFDAQGHRVLIGATEWEDCIWVENDSEYPFILDDEFYYSTNHTENSISTFTFTVAYSCTLELYYSTSSEEGCDRFIISVNGENIAECSGESEWHWLSLELNTDDVVTVSYQKDGSVDSFEDTAWFSFYYPQIEVDIELEIPAEDIDPTEDEDVICSFCGTVVKEALGQERLLGDLNRDGEVNSMDSNLLKRFLVGVRIPTNEQLTSADINNDGDIDSLDSYLLRKIISGSI